MNLEQMETALKRYGFDSTDPLAIWLNAALHEMENDLDWPWLEKATQTLLNTTIGSAALLFTGTNHAKVVSVRNETTKTKLEYFAWPRFVREVEDPTLKGTPEIYTR